MKSGNREINIFNMSLLDILCGALGAFCFMMLALFPHYGKKRAEGGQGLTETQKLLARGFLGFSIRWATTDDVDLVVIDPQGVVCTAKKGILGEARQYDTLRDRTDGWENSGHYSPSAGQWRVGAWLARSSSRRPVDVSITLCAVGADQDYVMYPISPIELATENRYVERAVVTMGSLGMFENLQLTAAPTPTARPTDAPQRPTVPPRD